NPAFAGNGGKRIALNTLSIRAGRSCLMLVQMGSKPLVPAELTRKPFTIEEARRAGLRRWHLEGASWRRVGSSTYIWAGLPETPIETLAGALRRLPAGTAFSGLTAAWLHGIGVSPCHRSCRASAAVADGVPLAHGSRAGRSTPPKGASFY